MKTKQNNDMIDHIDLFYAKTEIELLWLFYWVQFVRKTRQDNDLTDHKLAVYTKNDTKLLWPIGSGADCEENQIG